MRTVISNKIYIYDATQELYFWVQDNLEIVNPTYQTLKKLGKEDTIARRHVPERMKLYVEKGYDLILPFGCLHAIWPMIKNKPFSIQLNDNGQVIDKNMKISTPLYDYQEEAVQKMILAKGGVLQASAGSGKTQIGIEIAKRLGRNTLWLCGKTDLLNQTVARIHSLYPTLSVGTITDGTVKMVKDGITVSTIQTLVNVDTDVYSNAFDTVVVDECFPAGTKISTNKGYKNIENIKIGDKVLSFNHRTKKAEYKKVLNLFVKTSLCLTKVILNGKTLIATNNHPIYTQRGYVAAEDLKYGDYVLRNMRETRCRGRISKKKTGMGESEEKRFFVWQRVESVQNYQQSNKEKSKRSYTVYNFEVEDNNNYFANDILVHNCHSCVSAPTKMLMFGKVLGKIAARYKYGLTATPSRSDTMIKSMYSILGCDVKGEFKPTWIIEKEKTNTLTAEHIRYDLDTPFSYECLDESGMFDYLALIDVLSHNKKRNEEIINNVIKSLKTHKKQLVLSQRVEHCELLNNMLQERGIKSVLLVGKVSKKKREEILVKDKSWNVIVGSVSLVKEGLDIPELSCLHWAMVISDKVATIQSAGRIERMCEGKPEPVIYDYVDKNYPYCVGKYKKRVSWLKKR